MYFEQPQCDRGDAYCGFYLTQNLGFDKQDLPKYDDQAIYYCENPFYPDYVKKCDTSCGLDGKALCY
ncbi:hypothetical protein BDV33DRAFT_168438 [Aspergillus novoparasiticus]|uniref:Uncharacterized protein n=1 Tax=Aspergillus novoparasiticus TaxID=986946 RepID=A0A5N6EZ66_9EURO|nr:hypothetical protein BDV33DRAFT_168438 [Aspergillus novoparasiticus]